MGQGPFTLVVNAPDKQAFQHGVSRALWGHREEEVRCSGDGTKQEASESRGPLRASLGPASTP